MVSASLFGLILYMLALSVIILSAWSEAATRRFFGKRYNLVLIASWANCISFVFEDVIQRYLTCQEPLWPLAFVLTFFVVCVYGIAFLFWLEDGRFSVLRERLTVLEAFSTSRLAGSGPSPMRVFATSIGCIWAAAALGQWIGLPLVRIVLGLPAC